jgi:hypothetical protein
MMYDGITNLITERDKTAYRAKVGSYLYNAIDRQRVIADMFHRDVYYLRVSLSAT